MQHASPLLSSALEYARAVGGSACPDTRGEQSKKLLVFAYEVCRRGRAGGGGGGGGGGGWGGGVCGCKHREREREPRP